MSWSRTHYLTIGFLMMFCGLHFRVVESFVLTPQATKFLNDNSEGFDFGGDTFNADGSVANQNYNPALFNPTYQQASSYGTPQWQNVGFNTGSLISERKTLTPPTWMGWPMICAGAVLWLFGFTAPNSGS